MIHQLQAVTPRTSPRPAAPGCQVPGTLRAPMGAGAERGSRYPVPSRLPTFPPARGGLTGGNLSKVPQQQQPAFFSGEEPRNPQPRARRSCGLSRGVSGEGAHVGSFGTSPTAAAPRLRTPRRHHSSAIRSHHRSASPAETGPQTTLSPLSPKRISPRGT